MQPLGPARRLTGIGGHRDLSWDVQYTVRKAPRIHRREDATIHTPNQSTLQLVNRLLDIDREHLDPPEFSFQALKQFLMKARYETLTRPPHPTNPRKKLAFFDDRRDQYAGLGPTRDWDSAEYRDVPPAGVNDTFGAVDEFDLHARLKHEVSF